MDNIDSNSPTFPFQSKCLLILGMHRSGTSALTGVLSLLGIQPGDSLLPAMENVNPKGFWEHAEIVSLHDQLLKALGSSWDDVVHLPAQWWLLPPVAPFRTKIVSVLRHDFSGLSLWLMKDPRMCRLLPLWQDVMHEVNSQPLFILILRDPAEVAYSLRKRDNIEEAASCLLWLTHMLEAEYQTRGQPRIFIGYNRLLSDWRGTMTDISQTLCLNWPNPIEKSAADIETFLDPSLRHHVGNIIRSENPACRLAQEAYKIMDSPKLSPTDLNRLRQQSDELANTVAPWSRRLLACERENMHLRSEIVHLKTEVTRVKTTLSWQITKPLRLLATIARYVCNILPKKLNFSTWHSNDKV